MQRVLFSTHLSKEVVVIVFLHVLDLKGKKKGDGTRKIVRELGVSEGRS